MVHFGEEMLKVGKNMFRLSQMKGSLTAAPCPGMHGNFGYPENIFYLVEHNPK